MFAFARASARWTQAAPSAVAKAMVQGTVGRLAYGRTLALLDILHEIVEPALARDTALWTAFGRPQGRAAALRRDLLNLGVPPHGPDHPLHPLLASLVLHRAELLGAAFIVEGSRAGSRILVPRLAAALGVPVGPGVGIDLHLAAGPAGTWMAILADLGRLPWSSDDFARAGRAAARIMEAMVPAFDIIDPREIAG